MSLLQWKVADCTRTVAGAFCTRLLRDLGADVTRFEAPSDGNSASSLGDLSPFPGHLRGYLDRGKRVQQLDPLAPSSVEWLKSHLDEFDVIIEDLRPGRMAEAGLGPDELLAVKPSLVYTSITPFGQDGLFRDWVVDDAVIYAMGGYMYWGGDEDRSPLMVPGFQPELHGGLQAALATVAALRVAEQSGTGQLVDQSLQEAMLSAHSWTSVAWSHTGQVMQRRGLDLVRCADGWVFFMRISLTPNIFLLIDRPELIDDPRWDNIAGWIENGPELWEMVAKWCADKPRDQIVEVGQELRIPVTPVLNVEDLFSWPQTVDREWFQPSSQGADPGANAPAYPGFPYRFSRTPLNGDEPADSQDSVPASTSEPQGSQAVNRSASDIQPPCAGLRVIELTANWAGPLAGRILADLGAEVIKIEVATKPATRALYYAGGKPGKYHYNRSGYFNKLNRNKRAVSLDLSTEKGRDLFLKLVEKSDVVIENNSVRVMRNLGIEYSVLERVNKGIILASISGFGATGPFRDYVAHGANIEASCGLTSTMGYSKDELRRTGGYYADPIAGTSAALGVLAALEERKRTGHGQHIDVALQEAGMLFMADAILRYGATGQVPVPMGNASPEGYLRGCYACADQDSWVVISLPLEEHWEACCRAIGRTDFLAQLQTPEGRIRHRDTLNEAIAAWASEQDHYEAAKILQQHGVPAGPVLANWELLSDLHIDSRGFYTRIAHPHAGVLPYPGMPWKLSVTPGEVRTPAPGFAQDHQYVYGELLGLTDEEIKQLEELGIADPVPQIDPVVL